MTESKIPIPTCRPQGATLCKVLSLKLRQYRRGDISCVINKWAAAHEPLALAILYGLIALSVLSWLFSLKRKLQERRYYKAMEDDISWQIARARERGISMEDVYFDNHGDMRYKDTNQPVV